MPDADTGNDNIFASGSGGLESDTGNGGVKSPATGDGITGRIDPAIARATAGADATGPTGNGGTGGAGDTPGSSPGPAEHARRPRGRPPGSGTKASDKPVKEGASRNIAPGLIEELFIIAHLGIATATKIDAFKMDRDDAKLMGEATARALSFSNVKLTPQQEAYAFLLKAAMQVYPPMVITAYMQKQAETQGKVRQPPAPPPKAPPAQPAQRVQTKPDPITTPFAFDPTKISIPD